MAIYGDIGWHKGTGTLDCSGLPDWPWGICFLVVLGGFDGISRYGWPAGQHKLILLYFTSCCQYYTGVYKHCLQMGQIG